MTQTERTDTRTGTTPWQRFVALARKVTQMPKAEVEKREREWRENKKQAKKSD